ncbi:unnamed protein product [Ectocarpus sp. 13 AM-2016]
MKARGSAGKPFLRVDPIAELSSPYSSYPGTSARSTPKRLFRCLRAKMPVLTTPRTTNRAVGATTAQQAAPPWCLLACRRPHRSVRCPLCCPHRHLVVAATSNNNGAPCPGTSA